jgi:8-oxo-dGTP diphosphatase
MLRRVTRFGVYGVAIQNGSILLASKKSGCYKGLLDLPGGGIEFGESPEDTLRREFREEVAMVFMTMHLIDNYSHVRDVLHVEDPFTFHHLGMIYRVESLQTIESLIPEEQFAWYTINELQPEHLTPFASQALSFSLSPSKSRRNL